MRGLLIGLAMVAALGTAVPAEAQETGLPLWLVGTWCGQLGGPEAGPQVCDVWVAADDGTLRDRLKPVGDDAGDDGSWGTISIEGGQLVMRGGFDGVIRVDYREVSQGPRMVMFENRMEGLARRFRIERVGDDLVEDIWLTGRDEPQRTVYHLKK